MQLAAGEADHFYQLMWGLQLFVNQQKSINRAVASVQEYERLPAQSKLLVRDALYADPALIDAYVAANPQGLSDEDLAIVAGWKNFVKGTFYIERYLKKYAIFVGDQAVYAVLALRDSFDDFFPRNRLPVAVQAVLLPYKGQIIYDGLLSPYRISFGRGISSGIKERYLAAKQNRRIITSLDDSQEAPPVAEIRPDYSSELADMAALARKLRASRMMPPVWSPAFAVLRTAVDMAAQAVANPDDIDALWQKEGKIAGALKRLRVVLNRAE